jgi:hypothetical protein
MAMARAMAMPALISTACPNDRSLQMCRRHQRQGRPMTILARVLLKTASDYYLAVIIQRPSGEQDLGSEFRTLIGKFLKKVDAVGFKPDPGSSRCEGCEDDQIRVKLSHH